MSSEKHLSQSIQYNKNNNFDLSEMLMIQDSSRLTRTPKNILFENQMTMTMASMMRDAANSNSRFRK